MIRSLVLALALLLAAPASLTAIDLAPSDIHDPDDARLDAPPAIELIAARNGSFSGKLVVRTDDPASLGATVTDLAGADNAAIAAERIELRYGAGFPGRVSRGRYIPPGHDLLLDAPPADADAPLPLWVTVHVPDDAPAGAYTGELTVRARGASPVQVPVSVRVADWTLPQPRDNRTWIELVQSPDTLALEYDVELWSEPHWQMIERSFELMARSGTRVVYIPLIRETNLGNEQSMIRWVDNGDGTYEHDFTIMERYLDIARAHLGDPEYVVLWAWDTNLDTPSAPPAELPEERRGHGYHERLHEIRMARWESRDMGPSVTVVSAEGELGELALAPYGDDEALEQWRPVWAGLRQRLAERGLEDAMLLGMNTDVSPSAEHVRALHELSGGLAWGSGTHHARWVGTDQHARPALHGVARIEYSAAALGYMYTMNPAVQRTYGWQKDDLHAIFWRFSYFLGSFETNHATVRLEAEANITGNQRGVGRLGADHWYVLEDRRGRRSGSVSDRYPASVWRNLNIEGWMLGPGPGGPVGTARYEIFLEGVQDCEARIAIEAVLTDDARRARLPRELAERAQRVLDERHLAIWRARGAPDDSHLEHGLMTAYREIFAMMRDWDRAAGQRWYLDSDWAQRSGELFEVAGEVTRAAGE